MALTETQLWTVLAVLVVLLAVIVYNNLSAGQRRRRDGKDGPEPSVSPFLAKFVQHEGSIVGEVVALDGDRLVLKQSGAFKSVPTAQARAEGDEVLLTGPIDWDAALRDGAAWLERSRKGQDLAVSGALTRSEDVKAPAMGALKERKDE